MSWKRHVKRLGLGGAALLLLVAAQCFYGAAWGDDGRTGKEFSELLYDARESFLNFSFAKVEKCGTETALNLVNTLFKTRAELYLGDTTDPDKPRQWNSVSGPPTTITVRWTRFSDKTTAGKIFVEGYVLDNCNANPAEGKLKQAIVRYSIPVNGSHGHFRVGPPQEVKVETVCCGSSKRHNYVYNMSGVPLRTADTDFPPLPSAPPKPKPTTGASHSSGRNLFCQPANS